MKPTAQQQEIYDHVRLGADNLGIRARAGTGKTSTIIGSLDQVDMRESVLLLAFNKTIQQELAARAPSHVATKTINGFGWGACMRAYSRYGRKVDVNSRNVIVGAAIEEKLPTVSKAIRKEVVELVDAAKRTLSETIEELDQLVAACDLDVPVGQARRERIACLEAAQYALKQSRPSQNSQHSMVFSFEDQYWLPLVENLALGKPFDRVFVDETQDLNRAQLELSLRAGAGARFCAVGDDRQSIYAWRGADSNALDNVFERSGARVLPLTQCFRCPVEVIDIANKYVPDFEAPPNGHHGLVRRDVRESSMLAELEPGDFVVSRFNAPLMQYCMRLIACGRSAFLYGKTDFLLRLDAMIRRSKATSIAELRKWTEQWYEQETSDRAERGQSSVSTEDRYRCMLSILNNSTTISGALQTIESLRKPRAESIALSSTHQAKGTENGRVYVLEKTYDRATREDCNLYYVAITRAKHTLVLVEKDGRRYGEHDNA